MSFSVKTKNVSIDYNSLRLERAIDPALLLDDVTMTKIHTFLKGFYDRYTPKAENILAGMAEALAECILYEGPYAHYIWEGRLMVDPDTGSARAKPGAKKVYKEPEVRLQYQAAAATAHWDDTAWQNHKDEIMEGITKILTTRAKELMG